MGFKSRNNTVRPRPHQRKAIEDTLGIFKTNSRAQIHMACGSGKTLISAWIAQKLHSRKILVLIPSIALIHQMIDAFASVAPGAWNGAVVCGQGEVFPVEGNQSITLLSSNKEIKQFLLGDSTDIVFCTYQSSSKLKGSQFDFGVFDEAHRTAGRKDKSFAFANLEQNVKISKRLFMTATPRMRSLIKRDDRISNDMRNEALFGPIAHVLSFQAAVSQGIICDYKIVISVQDIPLDLKTSTPLQIATSRAMRKFDLRKAITFHRTVAEAQDFVGGPAVTFPRTVKLYHVNGKQNGSDRKSAMASFASDDKALMSNARCLTEGVDVPSVDLVVFASKRSSVVDIVQAAGRAMRNDPLRPQKRFGYILIPLFVEPGISDAEAVEQSDFGEIFRVLTAMSELDESLVAKLTTRESIANRVQYIGATQHLGNLSKESIEDLKDFISVRIIKRAVALNRREQLLEIARTGQPKPSARSDCQEERHLAQALNRLRGTNSSTYDKEFATKIAEFAPGWFRDPATQHPLIKEQLLELARAGQPRPRIASKDKSERSMSGYLYAFMNPKANAYDEKFSAKIRRIAPDWKMSTDDRHPRIKKQLLKLAGTGQPRPSPISENGAERSLAQMLSVFINPRTNAYDQKFAASIRNAATGWFKGDTASKHNLIKEQLLELARTGQPRPQEKSKNIEERSLKSFLVRAMNPKSDFYDQRFAASIRRFAPSWFADPAGRHAHKKEQLLELARAGQPRPRIASKDKSERSMSGYLGVFTSLSSRFYDQKFSAKIRRIAPGWFLT